MTPPSRTDNRKLINRPTPGPIVRVSPNLLAFNDPTLLPTVYNRHAEKTPFYNSGMTGETRPLLQIQGDREHAAKVKILGPTVSSITQSCHLSPLTIQYSTRLDMFDNWNRVWTCVL